MFRNNVTTILLAFALSITINTNYNSNANNVTGKNQVEENYNLSIEFNEYQEKECKTKLTCQNGCGNKGCHNMAATCIPFANENEKKNFLPPRSKFFPPANVAYRSNGPARPLQAQNRSAEYDWFIQTVLGVLPSPRPQQKPISKVHNGGNHESCNQYDDTKNNVCEYSNDGGDVRHVNNLNQDKYEYPHALTEIERELVKMSFTEWISKRSAGYYSCEDMAKALIKRAIYLQRVQHMNHFMYWDSFPEWTSVVLKYARNLDSMAASSPIQNEILKPMYCYPVPLKGTMATIDFPSSLGFSAIIYNAFAIKNADIVDLLHSKKGISFGKTNVPEMAHIGVTANYQNGIAFNPWHYDEIIGGSSGGSAGAVASYTAAIALSEDTLGSTNVPAVRNHIFSYDPPKFRYPNDGNPALSVRNDQVGVMARSIDDIIAFDKALLGTEKEHAASKQRVNSMKNSDIIIGCSHVYYKYDSPDLTPSNKATYEKAKAILRKVGFTILEDVNDCQINDKDDPMIQVTRKDVPFAVWYSELESFIRTYLGLKTVNPWEVLLNGFYDFGTSFTSGWMYGFSRDNGCKLIEMDTIQLRQDYQTVVPARRADIYNRYFDDINAPTRSRIDGDNGISGGRVHLMMGPAQLCDQVRWTDDILGTCDGGRGKFQNKDDGKCMFHCHPHGVRGHKDKTFTKSKFVVPIGKQISAKESEVVYIENDMSKETNQDQDYQRHPFSLHFMSRAGPGPTSNGDKIPSSDEWVLDEEGPKTWNTEELYIVKRITDTLANGGMSRAEATMNFVSGLFNEEV